MLSATAAAERSQGFSRKSKGNIIIPIGTTGFVAKAILDNVKRDIANYAYLSDYIDVLEKETNIDQIIQCVVKIITSKLY